MGGYGTGICETWRCHDKQQQHAANPTMRFQHHDPARNRQTHAGGAGSDGLWPIGTIQTSTNWRNGLATTKSPRGGEGGRGTGTDDDASARTESVGPAGDGGLPGTPDSRMRNVWALDAVPGGDPATMRACAQACRGGGRRRILISGSARAPQAVRSPEAPPTAMATFTRSAGFKLGQLHFNGRRLFGRPTRLNDAAQFARGVRRRFSRARWTVSLPANRDDHPRPRDGLKQCPVQSQRQRQENNGDCFDHSRHWGVFTDDGCEGQPWRMMTFRAE